MQEFLIEQSGMLFCYAALVVFVLVLILLVLFLGNVPKYLKGIMEQMKRNNDILETQTRNKAMNELMKNIIRDMVKEVQSEEKK